MITASFTIAAIATLSGAALIGGTLLGAIAEEAGRMCWRDWLAVTIGLPFSLILILWAGATDERPDALERAWMRATFRQAVQP